MSKVLVVGGAGYIGSHVVYELIDNNYSVIVLDDLSTGNIDNIDSRATFVKGCISNSDLLKQILLDIDTVIYLAAFKDAGESMISPQKFSQKNIIETLNLIETCISSKVKNFIFSSSAAVYGLPKYLPIDENHPLEPTNYYGFTKMVIEMQLGWYNKLKGLNVACLRYFNAVGYDTLGRIEKVEKNPTNLLPIVMEVATGKRDRVDVYGNDYDTKDGTCIRDYIHVNDLATAHINTINSFSNNSKIIINLATGNSYSVLDVINRAQEISNKKINFNFTNRRIGDIDSIFSKSNLAEKIIGWKCKYSDLDTILESMLKIYRTS